MQQALRFQDLPLGDPEPAFWLKTLRPLEDTQVSPRDRLEAYIEVLEFACDQQAPESTRRFEQQDVLLRYTQNLLDDTLRRAGLFHDTECQPHVHALLHCGQVLIGWAQADDSHDQLRARLQGLRQQLFDRP